MARGSAADVEKTLESICKNYKTYRKTEYMKTDLLVVDMVLGGGIPKGRMIEVLSPSGLGKSTTVLNVCKNLAEKGHKVIYLDFEGGVGESQLEGIGLIDDLYDPDDNPDGCFYLWQISTYRDAEDILDQLLPSGDFDLVVIDSVAAMINDKYLEGIERGSNKVSVTDSRPGSDSQVLSVFLKKYTAFKTKFDVSFIFINQLRTKINLMAPSQEVGSGGKSFEYYMDVRTKLSKIRPMTRKLETINGTEEINVGMEVYFEAYKSRVSTPFIKVPMTVVFGKGISNLATYLNWMFRKEVEFDGKKTYMLRQGGGGYYTVILDGKEVKVRGTEALNDFIKEHYEEIKEVFTASDMSLVKGEEITYGEDDE